MYSIYLHTLQNMAEHVNEIVETVFQYLALMRSEGPQRTLFQECAVSDQTSTVCLTRERLHEPQSWQNYYEAQLYSKITLYI